MVSNTLYNNYFFILTDVSSFVSQFAVMLANGVKSGLNILSSIQFLGTNLLSFFVYVFLLNIFLGIVFKLVTSVGSRTGSIAASEIRRSK